MSRLAHLTWALLVLTTLGMGCRMGGARIPDETEALDAVAAALSGYRLVLACRHPDDYAVSVVDALAPTEPTPIGSGDNPAISPDARWVAFVQERDGESGTCDLMLAETSGGDARVLVTDVLSDAAPAWAPDSAHVAAVISRETVSIVGVDGHVSRARAGEYVRCELAWSPDGSRIALIVSEHGSDRIATLDVDGSGLTTVTEGGAYDRCLTWHPDGAWLTLVREGDDVQPALRSVVRIGLDGTGKEVIARPKGFAWEAAWSPDGRCLGVLEQNLSRRRRSRRPAAAPASHGRNEAVSRASERCVLSLMDVTGGGSTRTVSLPGEAMDGDLEPRPETGHCGASDVVEGRRVV